MNPNHTPEPWTARKKSEKFNASEIIGSDGENILFDDYGPDGQVLDENAIRIVACVNAMDGIEDPAAFIEVVKKLELDAYPKMKAERDHLQILVNLYREQAQRAYRNGWAEETFKKQNPNQTILL